MKMRFSLLALCLLAFAGQAEQTKVQMWMWKDANGVVHYSDVPGPGAVKVDVNVAATQPGAAPPSQPAGSPPAAGPAKQSNYKSLLIVQPANEASYFDANATVNVQIQPDPALMDGDSLYLYVDGKRVGNSGDALAYTLSSLERGTHTLVAVIFDGQAKEKIRSPAVTIYLKPNTIIAPGAVGPLVKPPPNPATGPRPTPHG